MDSLPFGLSVHHFVSSVGADAGFAALIAVAILVLLYFAQARETATLRTRAQDADLRVQELEAQVGDLSDQVAALPAEISVRAASPRVAANARVVQDVPVAVGADGDRWPPSAPAGVAAPALAAATRLIPDPVRPEPEYAPAAAATAERSSNGSSRPVVAASAATVQRPVQTPAAGGPRPVAAPPRSGGRPPGAPYGRPPGGGQPRPGGAQARPGGPPRPGAPMRPPARRSRGRLLLGVLVAGVAVAAVAAGAVILAGGSSNKSPGTTSTASANTAATTHRTTSTAVVPATVTVSVLNGTDMQGLAGSVSQKLISHGYRKGAVTNASDQTKTTTVIQYAPQDRRDALAVATALGLTQAAVQPVDSATQKIACSAKPVGCNSAVFVTVGHDLATQ
jgi:hypothetical protein